MTSPLRPDPIRTTDGEGQPIVKIALDPAGNSWATVDAADYDSLPTELSRTWLLNDNGSGYAYVKTSSPIASGSLVIPARIIAGAGRGVQVGYHNGDRRDLRRRNLITRKNSRAKRDHLSEIPKAA